MKPWMLPGPYHGGGGLLPCGSYLLAPLTGNKKGSKGLTLLQVKPTPTRFPTNNLYTPMDNTPILYQVCSTRGAGTDVPEK